MFLRGTRLFQIRRARWPRYSTVKLMGSTDIPCLHFRVRWSRAIWPLATTAFWQDWRAGVLILHVVTCHEGLDNLAEAALTLLCGTTGHRRNLRGYRAPGL